MSNPVHNSAEQRLWMMVLHRAVIDAFWDEEKWQLRLDDAIQNGNKTDSQLDSLRDAIKAREREARTARGWLKSGQKDFRCVCDWAGMNPVAVNEFAARMDSENWPFERVKAAKKALGELGGYDVVD